MPTTEDRLTNPFADAVKTEAEVSAMNNKEYQAYQLSLKYYRDWNNVMDYAREEGIKQGIAQVLSLRLDYVQELLADTNVYKPYPPTTL